MYIHESELEYHGNLKSTKCLVDSRWVLQISGFHLPSSLQNDREPNFEDVIYCESIFNSTRLTLVFQL